MFYRLFAAGIVAFWLLMAALLVRDEWFPERGSNVSVPVDFVEHLVFRHEQPSDLMLYTQKRRLDGTFHVQPKRLPSPDGRAASSNLLSLSGNFLLTLPPANQRVVLHGSLEVDEHEQIRRLDLSISLREPKQSAAGLTLHIDGRPLENQWHFQMTQGGTTLREGRGTPEEILSKLELGGYGLNARAFSHVGSPSASVTLSAHRGSLKVNDDAIETFVVTIHQGDGMETTIYVNQLGQILAVKTFLGYDLYDDTLAP